MDVFCDNTPLKDLLMTCSLHGLPQDVTLHSRVLVHHGVMGHRKRLVNVGDFVKVTSDNVSFIVQDDNNYDYHFKTQVKFGVLLSCVKLEKDNSSLCIVRELKEQHHSDGSVILNEFDCPILTLTTELFFIPSTFVYSSVSVPHVCTSNCSFTFDFTCYNHDFSNLLFCYNIYCISNN